MVKKTMLAKKIARIPTAINDVARLLLHSNPVIMNAKREI